MAQTEIVDSEAILALLAGRIDDWLCDPGIRIFPWRFEQIKKVEIDSGASPVLPWQNRIIHKPKAGEGSRTPNLLITNQLLCH